MKFPDLIKLAEGFFPSHVHWIPDRPSPGRFFCGRKAVTFKILIYTVKEPRFGDEEMIPERRRRDGI